MSAAIDRLTMPKWGLTMTEGTVVSWLVREGDEITAGQDVAEVETDKMTGPIEAQVGGILRRRLVNEGDVVAIGGMLGVIAAPTVSDAEIDEFIARTPATDTGVGDPVGPRTEMFDVPLGPIRLVSLGNGRETVLLLHGFGGDALNWRFNIDALGPGRLALAIDLPGHGESTKNVGRGSAGEIASAVERLVATQGPDGLHLVGHSMGALVAGELVRAQAARIRSLTLIAPAGLGEYINREFVDGFVTASSRREIRGVLETLFADPAFVTRELVEDVLRYKRTAGVSEALATVRDCLFRDGTQQESIVELISDLDVPVTLIWGAEDRVLPATQRVAAPASSRIELLAGIGHSPHVEAAAEVNRILTEVLA